MTLRITLRCVSWWDDVEQFRDRTASLHIERCLCIAVHSLFAAVTAAEPRKAMLMQTSQHCLPV